MTYNFFKILSTILFVLLVNLKGFTQDNFKTNILINWKVSESINLRTPDFDFSTDSKQYHGLKAYHHTIALDADEIIDITLSNIITSELISGEVESALLSNIDSDFNIEVSYNYNRGEKVAHINIETFKKTSDNSIYKLISFTLNTSILKQVSGENKRVYADNSVFSNGDWYKVAVSKSGIYKISGTDLQTMGFSISDLDIDHVHVHGNGGGMLPEANSAFRYDDIIENAIKIVDNNSNGIFDATDYLLFYAKGPDTWEYSNSTNNFLSHKKYL